jgi:hypothetical protein
MTTLADLFSGFYRTGRGDIDFSAIRLHYAGADPVCRALQARALTVGSDIYFRDGAFAPHTREGLWLLAHEVAHVVQQQRGPVAAIEVADGLSVALADAPEEREADAAADALLAGRPFRFGGLGRFGGSEPRPVAQRYMAWEHCLLGDGGPACRDRVVPPPETGADGSPGRDGRRPIERLCALLEQLGRQPRDVDEDRLRAEHPGLELVRLPGSGLVVTLGELNILPDYLARPAAIETAPAEFLEPLIQSVRSWSIAELNRSVGHRGPRLLLPGSLSYPRRRWQTEVREAMQVDALGRRCGLAPWDLYSAVLGRNAGHFAPFSWYRWQSFHLLARDLIARSWREGADERATLRTRARIYAGYADHFLQDSYAAGHLINKTMVMQWYIEWLSGSRLPYLDRPLLERVTARRQPRLHGADWHERPAAGMCMAMTPPDPEAVAEAPTLTARIKASGVVGETEQERLEAYAGYLAMLGSNVAQLAAGVVHRYLNEHSLIVAAGADGARFRLHGDRTLLAGGAGGEGARRAAAAAAASRRAISELLTRGGTDVSAREILDGFPDHVEQEGSLVTLRQWHDGGLRDLCFHELFGRWRTRVTRVFLSASLRRLGVPSADVAELRRHALRG